MGYKDYRFFEPSRFDEVLNSTVSARDRLEVVVSIQDMTDVQFLEYVLRAGMDCLVLRYTRE